MHGSRSANNTMLSCLCSEGESVSLVDANSAASFAAKARQVSAARKVCNSHRIGISSARVLHQP